MRSEKLTTLVLLFILLTIATASVSSILIGANWISLWQSLLFGLIIGWGLAISLQPTWRAWLIIITAGIIYVLLFTSRVDMKVIAVINEFVQIITRTLSSLNKPEVNYSTLNILIQEVIRSMWVVMQIVFIWLSALISGQPIFDPIATAVIWSLIIWIVAAWAGWFAEAKKNALLAGLPVILISVGTLSFRQQMSSTVYFILGLTLCLVAIIQHDQREREWDETNIAYPAHKGQQIGNIAIIMAIGLVLLSAGLSSLSFQRLLNWVSERRRPLTQQDDNLAKSLGILPRATASPDAFEAVRRPGLPRDLLIGSGPELSERVVMSVSIENLSSIPGGKQTFPFYWRSFTYDIYTGNGWRSSETEQINYKSGQLLQPDHELKYVQIQQIVRPAEEAGGVIYAAGEPVKLNHDSDVAWRSSNDLFGIQVDVNRTYEVYSHPRLMRTPYARRVKNTLIG